MQADLAKVDPAVGEAAGGEEVRELPVFRPWEGFVEAGRVERLEGSAGLSPDVPGVRQKVGEGYRKVARFALSKPVPCASASIAKRWAQLARTQSSGVRRTDWEMTVSSSRTMCQRRKPMWLTSVAGCQNNSSSLRPATSSINSEWRSLKARRKREGASMGGQLVAGVGQRYSQIAWLQASSTKKGTPRGALRVSACRCD